jgi:thiol-disulfide isomerase/thioredoxin
MNAGNSRQVVNMGVLAAFLLGVTISAGFAASAKAAVSADEAAAHLAGYTLRSLDGDEVPVSSLHGQVVLVNFWASWCAPCRKELPILNEWQAQWADRDVRIVAISIDSNLEKAKRFAAEADLSLDLYHDGPSGLARLLDLPYLPCTYLLDREGRVAAVTSDSDSQALAALHSQVELLAATSSARPRILDVKSAGMNTAPGGTTGLSDSSDDKPAQEARGGGS